MLPNPLHPALVHFPIVLAALIPFFVFAAIRRLKKIPGDLGPWILVVALAGGLAASAWVSAETGEQEEELVEEVVPESAIEEHEEAGELFQLLTVGLFAAAAFGLVRGRVGSYARTTTVVGAVAVLAAAVPVGHTGGELVYEHGAAAAYVISPGGETAGESRPGSHTDDRDDDQDDDDDDDRRGRSDP